MSRRKRLGDYLDWNPDTFEVAKYHVDMARELRPPMGRVLARELPSAIEVLGSLTGRGGLTCPAPPSDPTGVYRVGLDARGRPEIQRRVTDEYWLPV